MIEQLAIMAAVALLLWPVQNAQHEGAHALMVRLFGADVTKMVLYPTNANNEFSLAFWESGFTWAHMSWSGGEEFTHRQYASISIAPQMANVIVLELLCITRLVLGDDANPWLLSILAGVFLVQYVDGAVNFSTFYKWWIVEDADKTSDGWSFQHHTQVSPWICRAMALIFHLGFGAALVWWW